MKKGILYIVATPIGNLEDITFRAIEVLKSVDLIAAEDTRHASRLLDRYGIKTRKISYYDEIEQKRSAELIRKLNDGMNIALISDAGTPGVSDPGYRMIQKAIENQIEIVPIPGASSILAALVASGYATDRFVFEGFLPRKKGRKTRLEELAGESRTIIIFESPLRLLKTLKDLHIYFGERQITVGREITKIYEEFVRGALPEIISHFEQNKPRGEIVIVIEGLTRKVKKDNQ
ncbi:MAG TPA: 16S rRNA (cytidine(1402)-2'-O)-methyltransferase [Candidatus Marinimicrobia bacterium]|nr:16S rRNA (cytidine(1402)-2'-O)-methyltransferase [Candidatus Neomarinimicrobiota bacterium]